MLQPSYSELMEKLNQYNSGQNKINSRYSIVMAVSKRARQINNKENLLYEDEFDNIEKPVSLAIDELYNGKIKIITNLDLENKLDLDLDLNLDKDNNNNNNNNNNKA